MARAYVVGIWVTVAVTVAAWLASPAARSQQPAKEPRWEYKVLTIRDLAKVGDKTFDGPWPGSDVIEKGLSSLSGERWELVSAADNKMYLRRTK